MAYPILHEMHTNPDYDIELAERKKKAQQKDLADRVEHEKRLLTMNKQELEAEYKDSLNWHGAILQGTHIPMDTTQEQIHLVNLLATVEQRHGT